MKCNLPLIGKKILVTRGESKGQAIADRIAKLGGIAFIAPMIDFQSYQDLNRIEYINKLHQYDWIVFTSQNGVTFFFEQLKELLPELNPAKLTCRIAAVGEKTKEAIEKFDLKVDFIPSVYSAADFIIEFVKEGFSTNHVLIPKGNLASNTIRDGFHKHNIPADEWLVYETYLPSENREKLALTLRNHQIHYATFTSPSCFHNFIEVVKEYSLEKQIKKIDIITIGKVTKKTVENYGFSVKMSPEKYTIDSMIESLNNLVRSEGGIRNE